MRLSRLLSVPLLLLCTERLFADEHNYSAFMGASGAWSNSSFGLHFTYEDTTKRAQDPSKHPWSFVVDAGAYADGPENQYLLLTGGRWSLEVNKRFVVSLQALIGYAIVSGSESRIRLQAFDEAARGEAPGDEEARQNGGLIGAGVGFDWIFGKEEEHNEDGPRVQLDVFRQLGDTPGTHVRASIGWVIRYR